MINLPTAPQLTRRIIRIALISSLVLGLFGSTGLVVDAETLIGQAQPNFRTLQNGEDVSISWTSVDLPAANPTSWLPIQRLNGYNLPLQLLTIRYSGTEPPTFRVNHVTSQPSTWIPEPAAALVPPALDAIPETLPLAEPERVSMPEQPLALLRQGSMRGIQLAVFLFSPVYQDSNTGEVRMVSSFDAEIVNAQLVETNAADLLTNSSANELVASAYAATAQSPSPIASSRAVKITVSEQGMQEISAADVSAAGLQNAKITQLQLFYHGEELPIHAIDANSNGTFDGGDRLRFYAPAPGDRWNLTAIYWLVTGASKGKRMSQRNVAPQSAPTRETGYQTGVWQQNRIYDSLVAGIDKDHWFHLDARVDESIQGAVSSYPAFTPTVVTTLPSTASPSTPALYTLYATATDVRVRDSSGRITSPPSVSHRLQVQADNFTHTDDTDDWIIDFSLQSRLDVTRTISVPVTASSVVIRMVADGSRAAVKFDRVTWQHPVQLNFRSSGGEFEGVPGTWRYRLSNLPAAYNLYDVTDPKNAQLLLLNANVSAASQTETSATVTFEDGPTAHKYVVAATGAIQTPALEQHKPFDFASIGGAHAIYVGPAEFESTLQPLIDLRMSQGYQVIFVDINDIYHGWSSGEVDPEAIRTFLRWAVATWNPAPLSVVLVGDSTSDPHDYEGIGNPNIIPAYLAPVDPWLGETACETCFVQLDGDNPISERPFLTDMWIGRFPVIDTSELSNVVEKIVRYETANDGLAQWRGRSLFLADDYIRSDGQTDPAGNFALLTENIIQLQPEAQETIRHYFNAKVDLSILPPILQTFLSSILPWVESDTDRALQRTIDYINDGAGLLTYTGHSNWWQYARLGESIGETRLFGWVDVPRLRNQDKYFIGLSMTCYTAQFIKPAPLHYTLDERLVLARRAGAVAMWGSAGLGVAFGHDSLQEGFHHALWSGPPMQTPLGKAVQAGYVELVTHGTCCQDVAHTFLLLGDPLMNVRVQPNVATYIPIIGTQP